MQRGNLKMSSKPWLAAGLMALFLLSAQAAEWSSTLLDGSIVTVDPDTNRATVTREGVTTPLWNGVHRTQDGSALIVNRGIAVPNESIIESRRLPPPKTEEWEDVNIVGYTPCEQLVRQVCGRQGECLDAESCDPAQQLLAMEDEERNNAANRNLMTFTSGQCLSAMKDREYFRQCAQNTDSDSD
jgi:Xaa-Pro aminopeptidase